MQGGFGPGPIRGVCLDLDGVLYSAGRTIPGAPAAVERLVAAGIGLRFLTNTTSRSRAALARRLGERGFPGDPEWIVSAPFAAAAWLRAEGIERISPLVAEAAREDFAGFTIDDDAPQAVVVGDLGEGWTAARLDRAMNHLLGGARLVGLTRSRRWRSPKGLAMDAGPYVTALEFAAGVSAVISGKPSPTFFEIALGSLGLEAPEVAMIGDDPESDVAAAEAVGLRGALVLTGKIGPDDLPRVSPRPARVFPSVVEAIGALGSD